MQSVYCIPVAERDMRLSLIEEGGRFLSETHLFVRIGHTKRRKALFAMRSPWKKELHVEVRIAKL